MTARGQREVACRRGHPFTEANTYLPPNGKRTCRRCATDRQATSRATSRRQPSPAPLGYPPAAWMAAAACSRTHAPDAWFPGPGQPAFPARRVCGWCPVHAECLEYAITFPGHLEGIWGGLGERERRRLRRERRAA